MPITSSIPLPDSGINSFNKGLASSQSMIDSMLQNKLNPYQIELLKSKAQVNQGNAAQSQMITNLLNQSMPNNGSSQGNNSSSTGTNNHPDRNLLLSAVLGFPTHVVDGNIVTAFGTTKVGESAAEKRKAEQESKVSGKVNESGAASYAANQKIQDSINGLRDVMKDPNYKNIAGTVEGAALGADGMASPLAWGARKIFSKKDQDLFGTANTLMGNLFVDFGRQFRGPFSGRIQGLVKNLKPNMNESPEIQKGKLNALETLSKIGQYREELISQYSSEGMPIIMAMKKADEQIPFKKIQDAVENAQKSSSPQSDEGEQNTERQEDKGEPTIIMYKGKDEYRFPAKYKNHSKLKGYTLEPT